MNYRLVSLPVCLSIAHKIWQYTLLASNEHILSSTFSHTYRFITYICHDFLSSISFGAEPMSHKGPINAVELHGRNKWEVLTEVRRGTCVLIRGSSHDERVGQRWQGNKYEKLRTQHYSGYIHIVDDDVLMKRWWITTMVHHFLPNTHIIHPIVYCWW